MLRFPQIPLQLVLLHGPQVRTYRKLWLCVYMFVTKKGREKDTDKDREFQNCPCKE